MDMASFIMILVSSGSLQCNYFWVINYHSKYQRYNLIPYFLFILLFLEELIEVGMSTENIITNYLSDT